MVGENLNFSEIPLGQEQWKQILSSPEGTALIQLLQKDGGLGIQTAAQLLRQGDSEGARAALTPLLQGTQGEALAETLGSKL